ncbi:MAG: tetratricopeptide repeat protein [Pyrinomonadaceae bacterium]
MKIIAFLLLLFLGTNAFGQMSADRHQKLLTLAANRQYQAAAEELEALRKTDKDLFHINNYDYLLARLYERSGDFPRALAVYQEVLGRNSVLREYALWHLAQISRWTGNPPMERMYLGELLLTAPDSLVADAADSRLARSYLESRDFDRAIARLRAGSNPNGVKDAPGAPDSVLGYLTGNDARTREDLVLLGQAYRQSGNAENARTVFSRLADNPPNPGQPDDFALEGVRGLDRLDVGEENFGRTVPRLTDTEHIRRATIYQFNRDFENARLHYQSLIAQFPKNPNVPMCMYQIGRGLVQEDNFSQAADWFERVQGEFPESHLSQDALYQAASAYARVNKTKESIARYQKYIETYPEASNLERAYLNIVDVLRDKGETSNAINWTDKTRDAFRDKLPEAVALFARARIHLSQQDWKRALADFESLNFLGNLGNPNTPGGTSKDEIRFLKGFALEQLNRYDEAIDVYLSIPDGRRAYYGWRANERLLALLQNPQTGDFVRRKFYPFRIKSSQSVTAATADEIRKAAESAYRLTDVKQAREQILGKLRKAYSFLPDYQKIPELKLTEAGRRQVIRTKPPASSNHHRDLADELLFLGLYDEGTPEMEIAGTENPEEKDAGNQKDRQYTLAVFYKRGDMANRATAFVEPLWRKVPDDYRIELIPRGQIELLYPTPYIDSLLKSAPQRGVDPRFALSIMRQESRFRADVKSAAAARGLMQFISSTSGKIAFELSREDFRQDELYHPPTAILFGSQYLSDLFHQFPDQPQAVAASYNAGEDNMKRWYARSSSNDPDRYVPEILYAQTKDYVFKVMQNYRIYRMLYDQNLIPAADPVGDK